MVTWHILKLPYVNKLLVCIVITSVIASVVEGIHIGYIYKLPHSYCTKKKIHLSFATNVIGNLSFVTKVEFQSQMSFATKF
jgi:hypothetical protein